MTSEARVPPWIWLALCVLSFLAAGFVSLPEQGAGARRGALAQAETMKAVAGADASHPELPEESAKAPSSSDEMPTALAEAAEQPGATRDAANPPQPQGAAAQVPAGAKVLRCVVQGRASYVDAASACPDGSVGKVTLLPR